MTTITGRLETPRASQYLQQLCKHFGHRVETTFDERAGSIALPMGRVMLEATPTTLLARVEGEPDGLGRAREVLDSHLKRFAFREEVEGLVWDEPAAGR